MTITHIVRFHRGTSSLPCLSQAAFRQGEYGCIQTGPRQSGAGGHLRRPHTRVVCERPNVAVCMVHSAHPALKPSRMAQKGLSSRGGFGPLVRPPAGRSVHCLRADGGQALWPLLTTSAASHHLDDQAACAGRHGVGHADARRPCS